MFHGFPFPDKQTLDGLDHPREERRVFPGLTVSENVEIGRIGGRRDAEKPTVDAIVDERARSVLAVGCRAGNAERYCVCGSL